MANRSRHTTDQELLMALDGELPAERLAAIETHMAGCGSCPARWEALRATLKAVNETVAAEHSSYPPPASRERLESRLRKAAQGQEPWWVGRFPFALTPRRLNAGLAIAASVALAVAWIAPLQRGQPTASAPSLPVPSLTPGAVANLTAGELCAGVKPSRVVSDAARRQVLQAYRMEHVSASAYELDALITPELGGTADTRNLWPQMYDSPVWNARVKDQLEDLLSAMVCRNEIDLARAQHDIAANWVAAYKHYFKTANPLQAYVGQSAHQRLARAVGASQPPPEGY